MLQNKCCNIEMQQADKETQARFLKWAQEIIL